MRGKKQKINTIPLVIGAWNVRTMTDIDTKNRPERRTALIGRELARYNVDIAALSETRLAGEGQICESGAGYTFYWSGRDEKEKRESGVGFAIKNTLIGKLAGPPKGTNDRIITVRIPMQNGRKHTTIISVYAPTMTNSDETKDKFYEGLHEAILAVSNEDKLIILGDFNARVGADNIAWKGIIGKYGVGQCNSNGSRLLQACAEHGLLITNTIFQLRTRQKTSWMHPRSKHWHQIDFVIVRQRDRQDVRVTKSMSGAECWTDHRLIISKLKIRIQPVRRPQGKKTPKHVNIAKLRIPEIRNSFVDNMQKQLQSAPLDDEKVESNWTLLREMIYKTATEILGLTTKKQNDWFDENAEDIMKLLDEKHKRHKESINDPKSTAKRDAFNNIRRTIQQNIRHMKNTWLSEKATEIQGFADSHDLKNFYHSLKTVYGPTYPKSLPLLDKESKNIITGEAEILQRWAEHFNYILNQPSSIKDETINRLPQAPINYSLDAVPTPGEVQAAIRLLSCGKAPGSDSIPAEIYKEGGPALTEKIHKIFQQIWAAESIPQDMKDALIIHLYKRKGNRQDCNNHRGISLLSIMGKILAKILLNRLTAHLEGGFLPESQCGFRKDRGTCDMVFAARQVQEKCQEQHRDVYLAFIDLTKAFDSVCRDGLWKIMAKIGCPNKFIKIVQQLHDGMQANVRENCQLSNPFPVSNGVKQGCVLAPTLFSIVFSSMLTDAFRNVKSGLEINYRIDGKLFNPRRLQAKTKVSTYKISDLLFADDCALCAGTESDLQKCLDRFSLACSNFGFTINVGKTEIMHQPAPGNIYKEPTIMVNGAKLKTVERFSYLGSTISNKCTIDDETNCRLSKASSTFGRLQKSVWQRCGLSVHTKLKVYKAAVLPTLLYASETWTVYRRQVRKLNHFHTTCLRKLLNIRWQDKIPDTVVLDRAGIPSIDTMLMQNQLRWAGHIVRMPDSRIPKMLFYGELLLGKRSQGGQKKRFKDTLKTSLKAFNIEIDTWETSSLDRNAWRTSLRKGAKKCETVRKELAEQRRQARKTQLPLGDGDILCPQCQRSFRAQIGLISHLKTHFHPQK
jgi:exonuclease III